MTSRLKQFDFILVNKEDLSEELKPPLHINENGTLINENLKNENDALNKILNKKIDRSKAITKFFSELVRPFTNALVIKIQTNNKLKFEETPDGMIAYIGWYICPVSNKVQCSLDSSSDKYVYVVQTRRIKITEDDGVTTEGIVDIRSICIHRSKNYEKYLKGSVSVNTNKEQLFSRASVALLKPINEIRSRQPRRQLNTGQTNNSTGRQAAKDAKHVTNFKPRVAPPTQRRVISISPNTLTNARENAINALKLQTNSFGLRPPNTKKETKKQIPTRLK